MHPLNLVVAIAVVMFILKQNKQNRKTEIQRKFNQNSLEISDVMGGGRFSINFLWKNS